MSTSGANGARAAASDRLSAQGSTRNSAHPLTCPHCGAEPVERVADPTLSPFSQDESRLLVEVRLQADRSSPGRPSLRFVAVTLFPVALLAVLLGSLIASGGLIAAPAPDLLAATVRQVGGIQLFGLLLTVFLVALLVHPFHPQLLRLLEGYWSPFVEPLARLLLTLQRRRRRRLERIIRTKPEMADQVRYRQRAASQLQLYPNENRLLATRLGNVMRAAEDQAGQRYGLDTVTIWPRLYPYVSDRLARALSETRTQLDAYVSLCFVLLVATLVLFPALATDGLWLALPAATTMGSWVSYRAATRTAAKYGHLIAVAFDLHRFEMLHGLHYPIPNTLEEELEFNQQLSKFLRSGRPLHGSDHKHCYEHAAGFWHGQRSSGPESGRLEPSRQGSA
jgi:hypothetical protein